MLQPISKKFGRILANEKQYSSKKVQCISAKEKGLIKTVTM